jgi:hypothetical protein
MVSNKIAWIIDSGCTHHMTGNKINFKTLQQIDGGIATFGGNQGKIIGI